MERNKTEMSRPSRVHLFAVFCFDIIRARHVCDRLRFYRFGSVLMTLECRRRRRQRWICVYVCGDGLFQKWNECLTWMQLTYVNVVDTRMHHFQTCNRKVIELTVPSRRYNICEICEYASMVFLFHS